jgi:GNAT superfamily N-acetyltransferase
MIQIREATAEDVPAIARVHVEADWETYAPLFGAEAYMPTVAESEDRWQRASAGDGLLLVACDQGMIVGLGHAHGDRVDALYILPTYHRRGIGRTMFARLIAFLCGCGVNRDPRGDTEDLIFAVPTAKAGSRAVP